MGYFYQFYDQTMQFIQRLTMQQWLYVLRGAVVIGVLCLRGFGSRTSF